MLKVKLTEVKDTEVKMLKVKSVKSQMTKESKCIINVERIFKQVRLHLVGMGWFG